MSNTSPIPLSPQTIEAVKATVPALQEQGLKIVNLMYSYLFEDKDIRELFIMSHHGENGAQPKALAAALVAYAENIDKPENLTDALNRIAHRHAELHILPQHYPYVATCLLRALAESLGAAATDEVLGAWSEAYWFLANTLIAREAALYKTVRKD